MVQFFPDPIFGWAFIAALLGLMAAATYHDLKSFIVPKSIVLALTVVGIVMTLARGGWNGSLGRTTWVFKEPTLALGVADGLLLSVCGLLVGFAIFFAFWVLGIAGGGDVKMVAAVGTWLGPIYILAALLWSFPVVLVLTVVGLILGTSKKVIAPGGTKPQRRLMSYTLPLTLGVAIFLITSFRMDLGLVASAAP